MAKMMGILFFERGESGWSESFGMTATDYTGARSDLTTLKNNRLALLCADVTCVGGRVSDLEIKGDSDSIFAGQTGSYVVAGVESSTPNLVLQLRVEAGTMKRSIRSLHCIPEDCVNGALYEPTAGFLAAFATWETFFMAATKLVTKNNLVVPPTYTLSTITAVIPKELWTRKTGRPFGLHRGRRATV